MKHPISSQYWRGLSWLAPQSENILTKEETLLIVGASARAAAFSALRARLRPHCVDLFADVDLQNRCPVIRLPGRYPYAFLDLIHFGAPGPWMYTGGLENWPRFVRRMAVGRPLWGNTKAALACARNPENLTRLLQAADMPVPALRQSGEKIPGASCFLIKPRKSVGGSGIRFAAVDTPDELSTYCQEFIEGDPHALLYLGDGRRARLLGMTQQLIGVSFLHAAPFQYCGSIGPVDLGIVQRPSLEALGHLLARECGLRGLFGVDGILRDGVFWPVEINPRYTASVEVFEYATGLPALTGHARVFTHGTLLPLSPPNDAFERYVGKAILFARTDLVFPADGPWIVESGETASIHDLPAFADIPLAGEPIEKGRPILTFFAQAASRSACEDELRLKADFLDRLFTHP